MARPTHPGAEQFLPGSTSLPELARAAQDCEGCNLFRDATQTVFGEGPPSARVVLVGEQPGDVEVRRGEPFVGPAGGVLDRALAQARIDRTHAYVTNAVKHFRWKATAGGTRRLHVKPDAGHVSACRPWLSAELRAVGPVLVVALGATAAQALLGSAFRLTQHRGELLPWPPETGPYAGVELGPALRGLLATIHPSAVLRADAGERDRMFDGLVADLRLVAAELARSGS